MGDFNLKTLKQEGNLYKYTNVVKGYQIRYFVVNVNTTKLNYFMSEDAKNQKPRGSIELLNSIISPSEEDSTTFTINTPDNEIFKLRAQDAKERQHWVNILRLVSHSKSDKEFKIYLNDKPDSSLFNLSLKKETHLSDEQTQSSSSEQAISNNGDLIREIYSLIKTSHEEFEKSIDNLPQKDGPICRYDQDLLILKASASSCVNNLINFCKILNLREHGTLNDSEIIGSICNSQRLDFSNRNLLEISYRNGDAKTDFTGTSPKKHLVNPDEELTEDENDSKQNEELDNKKHEILKFISNLTDGIDLSKISIPIYLFDKRSLLEVYADVMSLADHLIKVSDEKSPEDRFTALVKWFLGSFHLIKKQNLFKKPFNPILGEVFNCSWKVNDETNSVHVVSFIAEQVSHHPPISAFYMECKSKKIKLNANILTKPVYSGTSISIQLLGEMVLKLEKYNEEYHVSLPKFYARSIVTNPWIELGDSCTIHCAQTGFKAFVEFEVKSFYGENINQVFAEIKNKSDEVVCRVKGEWDGKLDYISGNESTKVVKTVDSCNLKPLLKRVRPINLQEENESRRVWEDVVESLNINDYETAQSSKHLIEKQQRVTEKLRKEKNLGFLPKNFYKTKLLSEKHSSSHLNTKSNSLNETINSSGDEISSTWWHKNWSN